MSAPQPETMPTPPRREFRAPASAGPFRLGAGALDRSEQGQTLPLILVFLLILLVMIGLVVDMGNAYRVRAALQGSVDASAAAGAGQLTMSWPPNSSAAVTAANTYGSQSGGRNPIGGVPASSVTQTVTTSCNTTTHFACNYANTVDVDANAQVPTYFLGLLGINSIQVSAHSTACSPCGILPLDIQLVVDRTGSMGQTGGASNGKTKMANLKTGLLNGFLMSLDPSVDNVGMTLLPPDTNGTADVCSAQSTSSYDVKTPTWTVVPLSNNYMDSSGNLISSSPLVSDINCMKAGGGTNYANAMEAAKAELVAHGRPGVQQIMVILSDGAANYGVKCANGTTDPHCTDPCHTAINDATTYKSQKILIYTILYGDQSGGPACQDWTGANETPFMQPWTAMQQMASPNNYYPNPDPANLTLLFQQIASDMAAGTSRITG